MSYKQTVCSNCGQSGGIGTDLVTGEKTCVICGSKDFIEIELPEELKCLYCKTIKRTEDILKEYSSIPFYDKNTRTYYCGCRGWE